MNLWRLIPHRHQWHFYQAKVDENFYLEDEEGRLVEVPQEGVWFFNRLGLDIRVCLRCGRVNKEDIREAGEVLLKLMGLRGI